MKRDILKGNFKNNKPHGYGYRDFGNIYYEGQFLNGLGDGYGEMYNADGTSYKGKF